MYWLGCEMDKGLVDSGRLEADGDGSRVFDYILLKGVAEGIIRGRCRPEYKKCKSRDNFVISAGSLVIA